MKDTIRWGILSTGRIAHHFAEAMAAVPEGTLTAVGSRTQAAADAFGEEFGITHRHGSYEALAADPEVDVIYVATPHPMHCENSLLCLRAGKAVLCEKPFTINRGEAERVIECARAQGVFLMEAMWTRFLPAVRQAVAWLDAGAIGGVQMVQASFGFRAEWDEANRLLAPELGGGALLDVGCYPVSLACMLLGGAPEAVHTAANLGDTGVDEQCALLLRFGGGRMAVLSAAVRTETVQEAYIYGTEGHIHLHAPFWSCTRVTLARKDQQPETMDFPHRKNGFEYQITAVCEGLREGALESPLMPHADTLTVMEVMDTARAQWGLVYPSERE